MIVTAESGDWSVVTQIDHAAFSADLLSLWRAPPRGELPRFDDLAFAVRHHDNGWQEVDAAPCLHQEGNRPHDFLSLPTRLRAGLWPRAVARFRQDRPWASALIAQHALRLVGHDANAHDADRATLEHQKAALLEAVARAQEHDESAPRLDLEADLASDYAWLELLDLLSLVGLGAWPSPVKRHGVEAYLDGADLVLRPFPLAGATRFRVARRMLANRRYEDDLDLAMALASSRWRSTEIRVC